MFVLLEVKLKAGKTGGQRVNEKKNTEFPSDFIVASFFFLVEFSSEYLL